MRTLQFIIATLLIAGNSFAQNFIEAPTPPIPPTNTSVTNSKSESITVTDGNITNSSSSSVNISDTNKTYKFKSKFNSVKNTEIASKLKKELKAIDFIKNGNEIIWTKYKNGKAIFKCTLSKKSLHILSNKKELASEFNIKIKHLGKELSNYISRNKSFQTQINEEVTTITSAQERLKKAEEELQKSIENLEKVSRESGN